MNETESKLLQDLLTIFDARALGEGDATVGATRNLGWRGMRQPCSPYGFRQPKPINFPASTASKIPKLPETAEIEDFK